MKLIAERKLKRDLKCLTLWAVWTYGDFRESATWNKPAYISYDYTEKWLRQIGISTHVDFTVQRNLNAGRAPLNKIHKLSFTYPLQAFVNL